MSRAGWRELSDEAPSGWRQRFGSLRNGAVLLGFLILLVVVLAIRTSLLEVRFSARVYTDAHWVPGETQAMRIAAFTMPEQEFLEQVTATVLLHDADGQRHELGLARSGDATTALMNVAVPAAAKPGPAELELLLTTPLGGESLRVPVVLGAGPAPPAEVAQSAEIATEPPGQALNLALIPLARSFVPELPNILYLCTTDATGAGVPAKLSGAPLRGLVQTDTSGLARVELRPRFGDLTLSWRLEAENGLQRQVELKPDFLPAQVSLSRMPIMVPAGTGLEVEAQSIRGQGELFFDLYHRGRWLWTGRKSLAKGRAKVTIPLPQKLAGLARIVAYHHPHMPGKSFDARAIWVGPPAATGSALGLEAGDPTASALLALEPAQAPFARELWLALARGPDDATPPLRIDTWEDKETALASRKRDQGQGLRDTFAVASVLIVLATAIFAIIVWWRSQRRLEDDEGRPGLSALGIGLSVVVVIAFALYCIHLLLGQLWWGW